MQACRNRLSALFEWDSTYIVGGDPDLCKAAAVEGGLDHPVDERPTRERPDVLLGDGDGAPARGDHRDDARLGGSHLPQNFDAAPLRASRDNYTGGDQASFTWLSLCSVSLSPLKLPFEATFSRMAFFLPFAWAWVDRDVGHEITFAWTGVPSIVLKGERHTGTHFLRAILKHNFPDDFQSMHTEPTLAREDCPTQQPFASDQTSCCWVHGLADDRCVHHPPVSRCQPLSHSRRHWRCGSL